MCSQLFSPGSEIGSDLCLLLEQSLPDKKVRTDCGPCKASERWRGGGGGIATKGPAEGWEKIGGKGNCTG